MRDRSQLLGSSSLTNLPRRGASPRVENQLRPARLERATCGSGGRIEVASGVVRERGLTSGRVEAASSVAKEREKTVGSVVLAARVAKERLTTGGCIHGAATAKERLKANGRVTGAVS